MPSLLETLQIAPREVIALVGAGGKTSAMLRIVAELRALGRNVVSTSTVNMADLSPPKPFYFLVEPDPAKIRAQVPVLLQEYGHVRVASERLRTDKIEGLKPEIVDALAALPEVDNLIVEADGARHRSLKAPNEREPVLPNRVDILLSVAGLDVVGEPLSEEHIHRPEMVTAITGLQQGEIVTPVAVAQVLASPQGGLKNLPPHARAWFVLTKWTPATNPAAREISGIALEQAPHAQGVLLLGAERWESVIRCQ